MATIGDVTIRIGATTRQLESDLKRAERALAATGKKFSDLGAKMSLNLSLPIAAIGAASFKMASDVEESLNKVRVAFGSSSTEVEAFADTTLESFGIARGSALDMAALFGDMATSMGITQSESAKLSTSLVGLAGDLASFKNIALSEVQTALSGIFTGETESLKRLGVVMLETNLEAFALEQGIKKKYKTMTQAEKVALRYQFVLNATKNAQGDFARTSDGAANQMRIFQESLKEVGAQFGSVLLPILTPVITKLNSLVKTFANLTQEQKNLIATLAGIAAAIGPVIYIYGQLKITYGKIAIEIIKLGTVTIATGEAAGKTAFSFRALAASLGPIAITLSVISALLYVYWKRSGEIAKANKENNDINQIALNNTEKERTRVTALIGVLKDETESKKNKTKALKELQSISPKYFDGLNVENLSLQKINTQYDAYVKNIVAAAKAQAAQEKIKSIQSELLKIEESRFNAAVNFNAEQERLKKLQKDVGLTPAQAQTLNNINNTLKVGTKNLQDTREAELKNQLDFYSKFAANEKQFVAATTPSGDLGKKEKVSLPALQTTGFDLFFRSLEGVSVSISAFTDETVKKLGEGLNISFSDSGIGLFFKDFKEQLDLIEVRQERGFISDTTADAERIEFLTTTLQSLQSQGFSPLSPQILAVTSALENMGYVVTENLVTQLQIGQEIVKSFAATMEGTLVSAFTLVGETIGQAFTGGADIGNFFNSILQLVANFAKDFGKQLIAIGVAKLALEELFKAGPVGAAAAIIAGTALVAASAALSSSLQKKLPSLAIGTDRVKSDGMAYLHKGEAVVPASVVEGGFTGGANGTQLYGRLSGIDLLLSNRYAGGYYNRLR